MVFEEEIPKCNHCQFGQNQTEPERCMECTEKATEKKPFPLFRATKWEVFVGAAKELVSGFGLTSKEVEEQLLDWFREKGQVEIYPFKK